MSSPPAGWSGPGDGSGPLAAGTRSGTVVAAVVFWTLAGLFLSGYGAALLAAVRDQRTKNELLDLLADSQVQVSASVLERILVGLGCVTLVVGVLTVIFGLLLLRRANWARILVTVVGLLAMPLFLPVFPLVLLGIVLQFLPSSNAWFRARAAVAMNW
jgi:hypothetical protein